LPRPIGIYTAGDMHSSRLLDICLEIGLAVPEDVAILGTDNETVICESVRPTLSSMELDSKRIGYEAAKLLDGMMTGNKSPKEIAYFPPSHVVVRQSTDLMLLDDPDLVQAIKYIRDFAYQGIDVDQVAEAVGISRSVLQRKFRRHLRRTPKEEILRVQIELAKRLMVQSVKLGDSIAAKCGFSSYKYFSKAFHREVGMPPQAYRRLCQISHVLDKEK
jgi:LacI family transcriptional regulator